MGPGPMGLGYRLLAIGPAGRRPIPGNDENENDENDELGDTSRPPRPTRPGIA